VLVILFRDHIQIPWNESGTYGALLLGVFFLLVAAYGWAEAVNQLAQVRSAEKQMLVLTPHGVVVRMGKQANPLFATSAYVGPLRAWSGARDGRIFAIPYERMRSVRLHVTHSKYEKFIELALTLASPPRNDLWRIDNRFPDTDSIAQLIIEAHARYTTRTHATGG
jgi:hypothetical protein